MCSPSLYYLEGGGLVTQVLKLNWFQHRIRLSQLATYEILLMGVHGKQCVHCFEVNNFHCTLVTKIMGVYTCHRCTFTDIWVIDPVQLFHHQGTGHVQEHVQTGIASPL